MAELKQKLEAIKKQGQEGENLYAHLSNIFSKILLDNPANAYDVFEDYSHQIRLSGYNPKELQNDAYKMREQIDEVSENVQKTVSLLTKINAAPTEEDPNAFQDPGPLGYVPNFIDESKQFAQAGVYFGEEESYAIFKSITKLSFAKQAQNIKNVRFWGKILCSQKDYYIAEGSVDTAVEGELPPNVEAPGTGVNTLTYWATNNLLEDWKELPITTPEFLQTSRKIRHIFTGNLDSEVITNPYFFGKEKDLLKAQIVRISHCTGIVPQGFYKITEEENSREVEAITGEDFKQPSFDDLKKLSSWQHYSKNILREGKITHTIPEPGPDEDPEQLQKKIEAKDPFEQRLKLLSNDKAAEGYDKSWVLKTFGDCTNYVLPGKIPQVANYGYIAIKSLVWPGALTVYHNKSWQSIYVGYGFKSTTELFFPKEPQQIQQEPEEHEDFHEPNQAQEEEAQNQQQQEEQ